LRGFLERRAVHELGEGTMRELHQRAALAFVEADQIDEAIDQLERAEDVAKRRDLILGAAPSYFAKGCGRTVSAWIERMPTATVEDDGWLLYWQALCCVGHEPSRAHRLFERAFARFAKEDDARGLHQSCAMAMQAIYYEGMDFSKFDPWLLRFEEMQVSGPPCPDDFLPMAATSRLLATFGRTVDVKDHLKWIGRATALAGACGDMSHRIMTGGLVALYFVFNENPARAAPILEMLRESARAQLSPIAPLTLFQADAWCAWARGENAACVSLAREALTIAARTGIYVWNDYIFGTGASATLSDEDTDGAREFLDGLAEGAKHGGRSAQGSYCFYAGWEAMVRGDLTRALGFAEMAYDTACALGYPFGQEVAAFGLGQVRLRLGQFREGSENIEVARRLAEQECNWMLLSGCDLVLADTLWEADRRRALTALRRGLTLGREHGYFNFLWIGRSMMARLAARALAENIESEYARGLILKRRLEPVGDAATLDSWPWPYRFRVLGTFAIERTIDECEGARRGEGSAFSPSRGMPLRLLRAILALGGRRVPDTVLIDALWPDAEGDAGRRVFDTTLHRLRRQFGDDGILRLVEGHVCLDEHTCWVDLWAFDASLGKIKESVRLGSNATLPTLCRQLLDLYHGPLLADAQPGEDFLAQPRRRRAMQFTDAAEHLGQALESAGHHDDAVSLYRRVLEGETGIERAYAGLIRCAFSTGREADAARLLDESRRRQREGAGDEAGGARSLRGEGTSRRLNIVR
jgi:DNA-binding SARP family transcriptional activator